MGRRKAKPAPVASPIVVYESWFSMQRGVDWSALLDDDPAAPYQHDIAGIAWQHYDGERRAAEMALWFEDFQRRHCL